MLVGLGGSLGVSDMTIGLAVKGEDSALGDRVALCYDRVEDRQFKRLVSIILTLLLSNKGW